MERVPLPRNIETLAKALKPSAFESELSFPARFAARRTAMNLVENDHQLAALLLSFAKPLTSPKPSA